MSNSAISLAKLVKQIRGGNDEERFRAITTIKTNLRTYVTRLLDKLSIVLEFREIMLEKEDLKTMLGAISDYFETKSSKPIHIDLVGNCIFTRESDFTEIFALLTGEKLHTVCVQFGYEFPFVIYNKVLQGMSESDKLLLEGRVTFERPWTTPISRSNEAIDEICTSLKSLNAQFVKQQAGLITVDNWTKHVDKSLERIGVETALEFENKSNGEEYACEFHPLGPSGVIWNSDNKTPRCELDGLLITQGGEFIVIEAKMFLNKAQLTSAETTFNKFSEYLDYIQSEELMLDTTKRTSRFNMQVSSFRDNHIFETPPTVVRKYLISNVYEVVPNYDAKQKAKEAGWILISRDGTDYSVQV
jgi:hypothetical protein